MSDKCDKVILCLSLAEASTMICIFHGLYVNDSLLNNFFIALADQMYGLLIVIPMFYFILSR